MESFSADRLNNVKEYYFSRKLREVSSLINNGKPIINLGIGNPDLLPPETVVKSLKKCFINPKHSQYQSYQGIPELRQSISKFYKNHYSVNLDYRNEILPLIGSKEGIFHISMAFLNPGDKVLVPNPGYPTYKSVSNLIGAETVEYKLEQNNNWQPNINELNNINLNGVKLMWINYPNMPTGAHFQEDILKELIEWGRKNKILIINDNPYSFILTSSPKSIMSISGSEDACLELNSLSKCFNMAGWRVGMLVGASDKIKSVISVKTNIDSGMFYGIQKAAISALEISNSWFEKLNYEYSLRKRLIFKLAKKMSLKYETNTSGLFIWAKIEDSLINSEQFIDEMLYNKHLFFAPGNIFGSQGEGYIRISLCVNQNEIKTAISRLN
ncbi:MAG: aminotransferase [Flavobacteriaceae bacterium]|nr:aminotransferase [Flavobacteriaceae bacterium]|tara:strand:- start:443 stop:1594 length:1152 start_codon:yes stop_codon:yes gene_type:complete